MKRIKLSREERALLKVTLFIVTFVAVFPQLLLVEM